MFDKLLLIVDNFYARLNITFFARNVIMLAIFSQRTFSIGKKIIFVEDSRRLKQEM